MSEIWSAMSLFESTQAIRSALVKVILRFLTSASLFMSLFRNSSKKKISFMLPEGSEYRLKDEWLPLYRFLRREARELYITVL